LHPNFHLVVLAEVKGHSQIIERLALLYLTFVEYILEDVYHLLYRLWRIRWYTSAKWDEGKAKKAEGNRRSPKFNGPQMLAGLAVVKQEGDTTMSGWVPRPRAMRHHQTPKE
jgi:hypothetical protein